MWRLVMLALLGMCARDETVGAYGAADRDWVLVELDGAEFTARAVLRFPEVGKIAGDGPCNGFSGVMVTPYPWFDVGQLVSTRRACPDLQAEAAFFEALGQMTEAEVSGEVLILRDGTGREMVFRASG